MKIENGLRLIKEKRYSFTTKATIQNVCKAIKRIPEYKTGMSVLNPKVYKIKSELSICAEEYPKEAVRSGDLSLYHVKEEIQKAINLLDGYKERSIGWGPERHVYDKSEFVPYPTINSKKDNPVIGDERAFVYVKNMEIGNSEQVFLKLFLKSSMMFAFTIPIMQMLTWEISSAVPRK